MDTKIKVGCGAGVLTLLIALGIAIGLLSKDQPTTTTTETPTVLVECSASRCTFGDTASIFKVSLIPKSPGEVIDGHGGWLVAQSGADSCRTDRFDFTSGTTDVFIQNPGSCSDFMMDTRGNMTIKVEKESGATVEIKKVKMTLTDGRAFGAYQRKEFNQTFSESFPLRPETRIRTVVIKLRYKNVKTPEELECSKVEVDWDYVGCLQEAKLEFRRKGSNTIACSTNPLPWLGSSGATTLGDLEFLGTCYALVTEEEDMEVRYSGPKDGQFVISNVVMQSAGGVETWSLTPQKDGIHQNTWLTLYYDEG